MPNNTNIADQYSLYSLAVSAVQAKAITADQAQAVPAVQA